MHGNLYLNIHHRPQLFIFFLVNLMHTRTFYNIIQLESQPRVEFKISHKWKRVNANKDQAYWFLPQFY